MSEWINFFKTTTGRAIIVVAFLFLAWKISSVVLLIFSGVLAAIILGVFVEHLYKRTRLPWITAAITVVLTLTIFLTIILYFIFPTFIQQTQQFITEFPNFINSFEDQIEQLTGLELGSNGLWKTVISKFPLTEAANFLATTFWIITGIFIILVLGIFLVIHPETYSNSTLFFLNDKTKGKRVLTNVHRDLKSWLKGTSISMSIVGILTIIGLFFLNIPFAIVLGVITALLTFIPNFGPLISVILAMIVAASVGPKEVVYVIILYSVVQIIESYFLTPLVQKKVVSVLPAVHLIVQIAMGALFGFLGLFTAVPIFVAVRSAYNTLKYN